MTSLVGLVGPAALPHQLQLAVAALAGVAVVLAVVLAERAAHARDRRVRGAVRARHDARLCSLGTTEVDAAFARLVAAVDRSAR